ncbi:MAG: signal peptidase I [Patescibacteria group bacterium]
MTNPENINPEEEPKRGSFFKTKPYWVEFILDLVKIVLLAFIIIWPIHHFVFQPFYVSGPSMEPNYYDKDYLIVEELSYRFHSPQRGEVIVFHSPNNSQDYLIKRVIGLPGERIVISKNKISVYNQQFPQGVEFNENSYLNPGLVTMGEVDVQLNSDEYYVLGDHRNVSLDSRVFGPIKRSTIVGRAWFRGWPFKNLGLLKTPIFTF